MSVNVVGNNKTNELVTNTVVSEYPNTISVKSNEFAVVGDGLFATTKEEVPGWMRELVGDLAKSATANTYNAMAGFNYNLYNAMIALQVAENKYQQTINTRITDQEAFVQAVETLNSTVQNAEAEIVGIKQTYATKNFAITTAAQTLEASLNGGAIKSSLGQLASTMTNQYGTMAQRMDILESTFEDLELGVEGYANATNTLETYVGLTKGSPDGTGLIAKVEVLQKQNDGLIETITGTHDVMTGVQNSNIDTSDDALIVTAEPYNSWKPVTGVGVPTGTAEVYKVYTDTSTGKVYQYDGVLWEEVTTDIAAAKEQLRSRHVGDVYIKYNVVNGANQYDKAFKFIKTVVDTTGPNYSTDSEGYTWALVTDTDAALAYQAALDAKDLADGKRRVFTDTPVGPYDIGDLWVRVVGTSNQIWRANTTSTVYSIAHWQVASTDDTAVTTFVDNVYNPKISSLQNQVDGQISYYYYESATRQTPESVSGSKDWTAAQKIEHHGDIAYDRTSKNGYWYDKGTSTWQLVDSEVNAGVIEALRKADTAQATADNVVVSYYAIEQSTAPGTSKLWLNDAKVLQKFTTVWEAVPAKGGDTLTTFVPATKDTKVYVYNGVSWVTETAAGIVASSKAVTDLKLDLSNLNKSIYGTSGLKQTLEGVIDDEGARVESKFAYDSTLTLNGTTYNSGFGLATSLTSGSGLPVGDSEFWINADKFKMTTTGYTGPKYSPFTVDGTNGIITFNGKVSFNSVTGVPNYVTPENVADAINNNTTTIDGSKITTGTIQAGAIAAGAIAADKIATGVITTDKIAAGAVGSINIANTLQSDNYVEGSRGWQISKNGDARFESIVLNSKNIAINSVTMLEFSRRTDDVLYSHGGTVLISLSVTTGPIGGYALILYTSRVGFLRGANTQLFLTRNGSILADYGISGPYNDYASVSYVDWVPANTTYTYQIVGNAADNHVQAEERTLSAFLRFR